jgi:hypothetical protein
MTDPTGITSKLSNFLKAEKEILLKEAEKTGRELNARLIAGMSSAGGMTDPTNMTRRMSASAQQSAQAAKMGRGTWANLSAQFQDIFVMTASGASPITTAVQQGPQIFDALKNSSAGLSGGLKELGSVALRVATHPITLITAAIGTAVAATVSWNNQIAALTTSLNGLGRQSGVTADQASRIAEVAAGGAGVSTRTARGLASQFLSAGVSGGNLGGAIGLAKPLERALGITSETLAAALADPARGAEELSKKYALLSYAQERRVKELVVEGKNTEATTELIRDLAEAANKLVDPTSRLVDAFERGAARISNAFSWIGERVAKIPGSPFAPVGSPVSQDAAERARVSGLLDTALRRQEGLDRIAQEASLNAKEITAQTYAQHEAVITERERAEVLRDTLSVTKAMLTAEAERVRLLAQAQAALQDYVRAGQQERSLLGKTSFQRGLQEIENRFLDLSRRLPGGGVGVQAPISAGPSAATKSVEALLRTAQMRGLEPTEANFEMLRREGIGQSSLRGRLLSGASSMSSTVDMPNLSGSGISAGALAERNAQRAAFITEAQTAPIRESNKELERQTASLHAQELALGKSTAEVARAAKEQELLNQFQAQGIPITDSMRASIAATAEGYGQLAAATEAFGDKQRHLLEIMDTVRGSASEALGGMATDLARGRRAADALSDALSRIGDRLISLAANRAIEGIFGSMGRTSGGIFGAISGLFGSHAEGGIVGAHGAPMARAPISAFIGAPQFASGGMVPGGAGPVPIIAHAGELILNAAQQHNTAAAIRRGQNDNRAAPVTVNLIGAPQGTKVKEQTDSSGARRIDVVMDERIAAAMGSPQGAEAARANYGMQRRVARR